MSPVKVYETDHPSSPWQVRYHAKGKRIRKHFRLKEDADRFAAGISKQISFEGGAGVVMDAEARSEWFACRNLLEPHGISILEAVRDFCARAQIRGEDLKRPVLEEAIKLFCDFKEDRKRKERTVTNLRWRLSTLAQLTGSQWANWTRECIEKALFENGYSARNQINNFSAVRNFSNWCVKRNWLPLNPCLSMETPLLSQEVPQIFRPSQLDKLLDASRTLYPEFEGWFAILCLTGVRPSELGGMLKTSDIRCHIDETDLIVSKGKQERKIFSRPVPLCPRLIKLLANPSFTVKEPSPKQRQKICRNAGITWDEDICRHSWISYRLALVKDRDQVSREAGNNKNTMDKYYSVMVKPADAKKWFGES